MPALPTGMVRHPNGVYYLRRRIPQDLLSSYCNKKEIQQSLNTRNFREALERHRVEEAKLTSEWQRRRAELAQHFAQRHLQAASVINELTDEQLERICQHFESAALAGDERRRVAGNYDVEEIEDYQRGYPEANTILKAAIAVGDVEVLGPILREFLALYRYEVNIPELDYRRLAIALGRTALRTNELLLRRYAGEAVATPVISDQPVHMLSEVVTWYLEEHYRSSRKTAMYKKIQTVLPMLLQVVGDKPISALRQSDINEFFEIVQELPPRWADICRQRKLSVRAVSALGLGEMAPATFEGTYKAAVTPFLKAACTFWQDRGFPTMLTTVQIEYRGEREPHEEQQRSFTLGELRRLFEGPELRAFASDPAKVHRFWLPYLGLYTGARINELCQINPQVDVVRDAESGIWFLDISPEGESDRRIKKKVKNASSRRKVPIHSRLIAAGFLDYVAEVRVGGATLLFPQFPPTLGRASPRAGRWFVQFMKDIGLRDDTPGARLVGMHAFRSTFLNRAMNLGVVNAESLTGHSTSVTALAAVKDGQVEGQASAVVRTYRGELALPNKREILEKIRFDEIQPPKPVLPTFPKPIRSGAGC